MVVMKLSGALVSQVAQPCDLVRIVKTARERDGSMVIVCTALGGITEALISAAHCAATSGSEKAEEVGRALWGCHRILAEKLTRDEREREALYREWAGFLKTFDRIIRAIAAVGEETARSIDAIAALGQRSAAHLVAVILRQGNVAAQVVDATELIVTDDHFGAARPFMAESANRVRTRLHPLIQAEIVPVITGYIGATREGIVTMLGRGGGDYSAALIGAALGADEICIWTNVDGILTADPKIVPEARTLAELSYSEAAEIATLSAEVLHPGMLAPVAEQCIPLHIRNALRCDRPGTRIIAHPQPTTNAARVIVSVHGLSLLSLAMSTTPNRGSWTPDLTVRALACLMDAGIEILQFAQNFCARGVTLAVRNTDATLALGCLNTAFERERAGGILDKLALTTPVSLVAVISGACGNGLASRTLTGLGYAGAHVLALAQGVSSSHISFILLESEVDTAVRILHRELGLAQ
jgi:aspartate kinase